MKKTALILALTAVLPFMAGAKSPSDSNPGSAPDTLRPKVSRQVNDGRKNEISASYGTLTLVQFVSGMAGAFGTAFSGGNVTLEKLDGYGSVSLAYYRAVNKWLSIGTDIAAEYVSMTFKNKNSEERTKNATLVFSPMFTMKGNWLRRNHFGLYSRIAAGAMFMDTPGASENKLQVVPTAQVSPVGVEFGGSGFRGFVEMGLGAQGVLVGGLKYRF